MVLAAHLGCGNVEFETNNLQVVDAINDATIYLGPDTTVYGESYQLTTNLGSYLFFTIFAKQMQLLIVCKFSY